MAVIVEYLERRGTAMRIEGRWSSSPCPACGGDDRFRVVFDEKKGREFYSCRQCGASGDDIQFLRDYEGMSFLEAKAAAECLRGEAPHPTPVVDDEDAWHSGCIDFIRRSHKRLMENNKALATLHEQRGIEPETAKVFRLGCNPRDLWVDRSEFGLAPRYGADGNLMDLCLPAGIVIPVQAGGLLYGVQIRRRRAFRGNRYLTVPGSELVPMVFEGDPKYIVVVESFLCGMLLWQELGGRATIVALGSVSANPGDSVRVLVEEAHIVIVALDTDDAGAAQSRSAWVERYPNAVHCPIPLRYGKDPTEAHLKGLNLEQWFDAALEVAWKKLDATRSSNITSGGDARDLRVGGEEAQLFRVSKQHTARRVVGRIAESCSTITIAIEIEADGVHPLSGHHPAVSKVSRVAVYAPELGRAYVFRMGAVTVEDLAPLWSVNVVAHDGVELLRHFPELQRSEVTVGSTMLMANALTNKNLDLREALDFVKIRLPAADTTNRKLALYALVLKPLYEALNAELGSEGGRRLTKLMRNAQRAVALLEVEGVFFNAKAHRKLIAQWTREVAEQRASIPADVDPAKHGQVRAWLVKVVPSQKRKGWMRTSSGELSTADANLALAIDIPAVQALREHRRLTKLLSTYGERFRRHFVPTTGRLHARWSLAGCHTGRMACADPNLLGLPRDPAFRSLFRAPDGRLLLVADVSQFQLRIAAHIADDGAMLAAYKEGMDLHTATAEVLTGKNLEDITAEERRMAKAANFGLLFGQGGKGFRDYANSKYGLGLSLDDAADIRDAWLDTYEGVAAWHDETADDLKRNGWVHTAAGRVVSEEDFTGNELQQALAFQIQGTEAEIMLKTLALLKPTLAEHNAHLVLFVHDEVVLEVPDDAPTTDAVAEAVRESLAAAFLKFYPDATTEELVEVHKVQTWAEAK